MINNKFVKIIMILEVLADTHRTVPAKEIAHKTGIKPYLVTRLLVELHNLNLVEVQTGRKGGFKLKEVASSIGLYDLLLASYKNKTENLVNNRISRKINRVIEDHLSEITLSSILTRVVFEDEEELLDNFLIEGL